MVDRELVQDDLPLDGTGASNQARKKCRVQAPIGNPKELHTMAITVLNNISDLTAENALSNTQASLQNTLTQLSTGLKINSGADDPAGLSIANGMTANIAALTQSQQNASNGVGLLQTADGALSQVTTLLNQAVTIATEGATSGITGSQSTALNTELQSILSEVNQIGQTTNFNGQNVFAGNTGTVFETTSGTAANKLTLASTLAANSVTTINDATTGDSFSFTANAAGTSTIANLNTAIAAAVTAGTFTAAAFTVGTTVQGTVGATTADTNNLAFSSGAGDPLTVTTTDNTALASLNASVGATDNNTVFISDSSTKDSAADTQITTSINALSATTLGLSTAGVNVNLSSAASAQTALTAINAAITNVSAQRGNIGASVNRLNAATSVMSDQVTNLQSAVNNLQNADIGTTVANMTQYNVLESTGMAALQQANQAQQAVLKLVQ
jgi:flagellin